ncbi:MAG: biotin/lipoyl-binding protein [Firmicutes bacterium]|nr:biotin/lipoyl-binding protein [Bacillota bacterium]
MNKTLKRVLITVVSLVLAAAVGVGALTIVKRNQKQSLTAQVTPVYMFSSPYYENDYRYGYVQSGFTQNVFAQEGAVIQEIYVQQGQEVKTGDPLLTYDPEQIQLELDRKELNIQVLQRRYERLLAELYELQNTKPSDASSLYGASLGNGLTTSLKDETPTDSDQPTDPEETNSSEPEESSESKAEESFESKPEESSESKPEESSESKPEESSESKPEESSESKPEESSESKPEESSESKPEESSESKPEESSESKPEGSSESKPEESSESKPEESSESKPEESSESKPEESSESKPEESSESKPEESSKSEESSKPEESSEPEPYTAFGSCTIMGSVSLVGKELQEGQFVIQITDADGKLIASVPNDAKGNFSITLTYDQDHYSGSPYVYRISQGDKTDESIIYDENTYTLTVKVTDNKDGKLNVTASGAENMRFTNVYSKTAEYEEPKEDKPIPVLYPASKPYAGTGTEKDPYHYWIGRNTKLISTFYEGYLDQKEPVYFVFDKREDDKKDGDIEYSWYLSTDGIEKSEQIRVYNLSVYQIPLDPQSYLMAVAENVLPKTMNLAINMIDRDVNVQSVTIVGEDVLEEAELDHSYFNVLLAKGGIFNLYLQYKEDDPDESSESSEELIPDDPEPFIPDYPIGPTGPTREELLQAISEKEVEIKDMEVTQKMAELDLEKTREKLENVVIRSIVNGHVNRVDPMGGSYNEPVVQIIGGDEIYVMTTISELDLEKIKVGDPVTATSWMTGEVLEGVVAQIGDYPVDNAMGYSYSQNPNVSNYEMLIAFPSESGLTDGQGVELTMGSAQPEDGTTFCIPSMYIRDENGAYYVLADQDGYLVKKYIQTGRSMYDGEYIEILGGITTEDFLAFPYGKAAQEGVKTVYEEVLYQ